MFLRKGHVLPLAQPAQNVEQINYDELHYITYNAKPKDYMMYNDDGVTPVNLF